MWKRLNYGLNLREAINAYTGSASDVYMYIDPLASAFPSYGAKVLVQGERQNKTKHTLKGNRAKLSLTLRPIAPAT